MRTQVRRLERLRQIADGRRAQQDDAERREREQLDAMTDEELARQVEAFARVLKLFQDDEADELAALVEEWQRAG